MISLNDKPLLALVGMRWRKSLFLLISEQKHSQFVTDILFIAWERTKVLDMMAPVAILQNCLLQVSFEPNICSCFSDYPACVSIWSLRVAMCSADPCLHLCSLFVQLYICLQGQLQYTPLFGVWLHICLPKKIQNTLIFSSKLQSSCSLVDWYQCLRGSCCHHLLPWR